MTSALLVHQDFPEALRLQVEQKKLVIGLKSTKICQANFVKLPKGYVLLGTTDPINASVLASEDDLVLIDRYISRGDVVKRNPLDAQSGTLISSSSICTLVPLFAVIQSNGDGSPVTRCMAFDGRPTINVDAHDLADPQAWNTGDIIVYDDWLGTITDVYQEITVRLDGGSVVVITSDTDDIEEWLQISVTSVSGYVPFDRGSQQGNRRGRFVSATPLRYGQRVRIPKQRLSKVHWLTGSYEPETRPYGMIIDITYSGLEVDWKLPKFDESKPDRLTKPNIYLSRDELEHRKVKLYDPTRVPKAEVNERGTHLAVSPLFARVSDYVFFKDIRAAESKYGDQLAGCRTRTVFSMPSTATNFPGFGVVMSQIISTTSKVRIRWQDNTITDEISTSVCPYAEVDDHDTWPGELVSLKSQEETYVDPAYEKIIRTRTVGVVQCVDAHERVAHVRWFKGADITITGEDRDKIVKSHSTLGEITEKVTITSLYEVEAHQAIARRRGDFVRIANPGRNLRGFGIPASVRNYSFHHECSDENHNWYGEIMDLGLDGRVMVRLGGLENVRDFICSILDLDLVCSADDATTESGTTESTESSGVDEVPIAGYKTLKEASEEAVRGTETKDVDQMSIKTNGSDPWESYSSSDDLWTTDSANESRIDFEPPRQEKPDQICMETASSDSEMDDKRSAELSLSNKPERRSSESSSSGTFQPISRSGLVPFEILEGSGPEHTFATQSGDKPRTWLKAVSREHKILRSSLPDGVYVRTWDSSMELIRVLIIGPLGTPYALAPFLFDIHLGERFPYYAPSAFFHSWTNGIGRVNPNLYEDGKVCLSLLGTWHSQKDNESWVTGRSSVLQIIVSLLGLVLVKEPYYSKFPLSIHLSSQYHQSRYVR